MTIDLTRTEPRWYQKATEAALCHAGRTLDAERIHLAHPRDLAELFCLLPDDVCIKLWEATNGQALASAD